MRKSPEAHTANGWLTWPLFPSAITVAWILQSFAISGDPLPDLWRTLLIATALAGSASIAAWLALRRSLTAQIAIAWTLVLFLKAWPLLGVLAAVALWPLLVSELRRWRQATPPNWSAPAKVVETANAFGLVLFAVSIASLLLGGVIAVGAPTESRRSTANVVVPPPVDVPGIYLVLLDGYPRGDTLASLGIDNSGFLANLEDRGLAVAERSRSNYSTTLLTLTSMLHADYVHAIPALANPPGTEPEQIRLLTRTVNQAPLLERFRQHGYRIVTARSVYGAAMVTTADEVIDHGRLSQFEERIVRQTYLRDVLAWADADIVAWQLREAVLDPIRDVESVARSSSGTGDKPVFMLAHVFAPHPPFLFGPDGGRLPLPACYQQGCPPWTTEREELSMTQDEYRELLAGQLAYLNRRLLEMVDGVIGTDPNAVVILFSDHGARFDAEVTDEYFRTLFAARTPGREGLYSREAAPVNLLAVLMNAYLDEQLSVRSYAAWASVDRTFDLVPWDGGP